MQRVRVGLPHALALSFNDPRGMCPECAGLARLSKIDVDALVDKNKSLADAAILFTTFNVDGYHWAILANSGFFDVKKKLRDYTKSEWDKFLYLDDPKVKVKSLGNLKSSFEGLIVKFKWLSRQRCGANEGERAAARASAKRRARARSRRRASPMFR